MTTPENIPNEDIQKARDWIHAADERQMDPAFRSEVLALLTPAPKRHTFGRVAFVEDGRRHAKAGDWWLSVSGEPRYIDVGESLHHVTILRPIDPSAKYREYEEALSRLATYPQSGHVGNPVAAMSEIARWALEGGAE